MTGLPSLLRALSLGYWRRHPTRAILVLGCLALGVATWTATRALERGVQQSGRDAAAPLGGAADFSVSNDDTGVPLHWAKQFRQIPGIRKVEAILVRRARLSARQPLSVMVIGIDLANVQSSGSRVQLSSNAVADFAKAKLQGQIPVILGCRLAEEVNAGENALELLLDGKTVHLVSAGTIESADNVDNVLVGRVLVMDRADLARLIGQPDRVSRLDVTLEPNANEQQVSERLSEIVGGGARIRTSKALDDRSGEMFAGLTTAFSLCGIGAIIAGLLLIYNVLSVSVAERRHDSGILRSLGATRPQIMLVLWAEAVGLGLIGGILGLPLGYGLVQIAVGPIQAILSEMFLPLAGIDAAFSLTLWTSGVTVGVLASILAATIPAAQAAGVDPMVALRRIDASPERPVRWRSLLPAAAMVLAGGLIHFCLRPSSSGTWASLFCFVAAMLFLAPQLTRLLTLVLRRAIRRWAGVGSMLALDNLLRWPRRYGLATATLAGGAALLVQTGGVIRSNEEALRDWLDRSVIGDLFVTSGGPLSASGQNQPMSDDLAAKWCRRIPGLRVVPMRFRYVDWQQDRHSARLLLVLLDAPSYRSAIEERFPNLPDRALYQQLSEEPDAALVSRNFAALHGLKPGDTLSLPSAEGPKSFRILGAVADYSCMQGTVLLDRSRHSRAFNAGLADVFSVTVPAGVDIERARQECIQSSTTASESMCVVTHEEMRSHTLGMIHRLYGVAVAQQALVALISILGVAATMAISVLQRSGELGLLRGLGCTQFQMIRVVLAEAFLIGVLGTAVGLLLGIPLEWFTVKVVLLAETGFVFPMQFPWREALIVGLTAPGCAALAGVFPALTAARMNLAGTFACE